MWNHNKYHSHAVVFDGRRFASRKEAARYQVLRLMEKSGKIINLEMQPRFELQPAFEKRGVKYRAINYVADFCYVAEGSRMVVEDTKGFQTAEFKIKHKLFEFKYPNLSLTIT